MIRSVKVSAIHSKIKPCVGFTILAISPSCSLYPPACKSYGLEAEQEAESVSLLMK